MLKRVAIFMLLALAFAGPASAEVNGFYGGLKFIDSISSTGAVSSKAKSRINATKADEFTQNTVGGGVFFGYDLYPQHQIPLRVEVEYALRSQSSNSKSSAWGNDFDYGGTTDLKTASNIHTLMANFYLDFHNSTAFTPYIGAGAGVGFINNELKYDSNWHDRIGAGAGVMTYGDSSKSISQTNTVFAWNVGAGLAYAFNENISADLAYRFVGFSENKVEASGVKYTSHPNLHEFSLGLRFTF